MYFQLYKTCSLVFYCIHGNVVLVHCESATYGGKEGSFNFPAQLKLNIIFLTVVLWLKPFKLFHFDLYLLSDLYSLLISRWLSN